MTSNYYKYKELQRKWSNAETKEECDRLMDIGIKYRDKFTKEDWLQLIKDAGSGRARYEYTRMMNERFPETKDEK